MANKRIQMFRDKVNYSIWLNMTFNKINEEMEKELMRKYKNFVTEEKENNQNKIWKNPWHVDNEWMKWMFKTSKWKPKVQISAKYDPKNTCENTPNIYRPNSEIGQKSSDIK